jgi:hypothetical protein
VPFRVIQVLFPVLVVAPQVPFRVIQVLFPVLVVAPQVLFPVLVVQVTQVFRAMKASVLQSVHLSSYQTRA